MTKAKEMQADSVADAKKVAKLFGRALERADRALELDKQYHEAWNLKGFALRQLGQLDKSAEVGVEFEWPIGNRGPRDGVMTSGRTAG